MSEVSAWTLASAAATTVASVAAWDRGSNADVDSRLAENARVAATTTATREVIRALDRNRRQAIVGRVIGSPLSGLRLDGWWGADQSSSTSPRAPQGARPLSDQRQSS